MSGQIWSMAGSSPPARGTARPARGHRPQNRFIPACAGNGIDPSAGCLASPVHPRLRGERMQPRRLGLRIGGSSPPARGTGRHPADGTRPSRFIPACAGNGNWPSIRLANRSVHPRLRGERCLIGSGWADVERFIPACAGNGNGRAHHHYSRAVHPRLRGERPLCTRKAGRLNGSSPPARGTDALASLVCIAGRFIPACAGNGPGLQPTRII